MSISSTLNRLHSQAKNNSWMWLFSIFCRFALALGFIPAAIVKLIDERFASGLHANHPMGSYLEALHHTGFYYTFIGVVQLLAAIFLLIPRTVTFGAFLYFPVILNIAVLTYATRFDGSLFTAPLMTLANLYVLGWNYERWKYILPFNRLEVDTAVQNPTDAYVTDQENVKKYGINRIFERVRKFIKQLWNDKFPTLFFAGVVSAVIVFMIVIPQLITVKPRNTFEKCQTQFKDGNRRQAGETFCKCIHNNGEPLNKCLNDYNNTLDDTSQTQ